MPDHNILIGSCELEALEDNNSGFVVDLIIDDIFGEYLKDNSYDEPISAFKEGIILGIYWSLNGGVLDHLNKIGR